jgi:hypothetical protein
VLISVAQIFEVLFELVLFQFVLIEVDGDDVSEDVAELLFEIKVFVDFFEEEFVDGSMSDVVEL